MAGLRCQNTGSLLGSEQSAHSICTIPPTSHQIRGHGVVQGTNIAFGQAVRLVVSRGHDVKIDPVLGTVGFHGPAFGGGTLIRNDDIGVPKPWVHLFLKSPDSSLGCDVRYRDKDRVAVALGEGPG